MTARVCAVTGCGYPVLTRGWCSACYQARRKRRARGLPDLPADVDIRWLKQRLSECPICGFAVTPAGARACPPCVAFVRELRAGLIARGKLPA